MCNTFAVYFQIFATFGYKKVKNSDSIVFDVPPFFSRSKSEKSATKMVT